MSATASPEIPVQSPQLTARAAHLQRPRFGSASTFHRDLKTRADRYFTDNRLSERDLPAMYGKTAIILTWWALSWCGLVLWASSWPTAVLFSVSLGLAVATIGMSVMHDANHGGYSRHAWVNQLMGWTIDAMGASSHVWKTKHNAAHHTFTNIVGFDDDLNLGPLARMAPQQPRMPWHRFQHIYLWVLYAFLLPKWVFLDDPANLATSRVGCHAVGRPTMGQWAGLLGGKAFFVLWAIVIPAMLHPGWMVTLGFFGTCAVVGVTLAVTFQLAHCVQEAEFVTAPADGRLDVDWAVHQLATTVDFAPDNKLVTWAMGGLNFQVVHHLFPKVCHLHYPALTKIVAATAADHGLQYRSTQHLSSAIASHYRLLRELGRPEQQQMAAVAAA